MIFLRVSPLISMVLNCYFTVSDYIIVYKLGTRSLKYIVNSVIYRTYTHINMKMVFAETAAGEGSPPWSGRARRPGSRAAIVSTMRFPSFGADAVVSFVRYHARVGFERMYLFFDDPLDRAAELGHRRWTVS